MADQHTTPSSSHSALTRESNRSSHSRVVGGRLSREVRRASHSRRCRRNGTPPPPPRAEPLELRRSSRLVPRSDYAISERWSYGADVTYETRYDTAHFKSGDDSRQKRSITASHDRKKHKTTNSATDDCIAHCTRSRTALRTSESACELLRNDANNAGSDTTPNQTTGHTSTQPNPNQADTGLLPLDDRDYAYSPFSTSTVTDLIDSDYSVYSPSAQRSKGKKRKRSTHRSPSYKRSNLSINFEDCRKRLKIDSHSVDTVESVKDFKLKTDSETKVDSQGIPTSCSYPLRNRHQRDLEASTSTACYNSASPSSSHSAATTSDRDSQPDSRSGALTPPLPTKSSQEAGSSKCHGGSASKLLIVPRDLPYLRQTNARRSIAAATGATLGACLTRGASTSRQRQDTASKRQVAHQSGSSSGRRARSRDMPQPQPASTRRDKRGKSSLGSCASTGGASSRSHPQPLTTGAVASTSATSPAAAPEPAAADVKPKSKASAASLPVLSGGGGGSGGGAAAAGAAAAAEAAGAPEESSSEEGEVGRLQALLEARGLPPHLLGALGPRMQHLLHRTVTANSAASKAAQLLAGLQATGDEGQQLQAVIEMCQLLVMGNEDTLAGFPVRQVVPALINLLAAEHNFDMMNHACRALTYMLEALPRSSGVVSLAVPAFLDKLQAITCMDVAEQSLTALDMLSRRHSKTILQARGVSACLMYLDFFSINAQRAALSITANCCQNLAADDFHLVRDSLQLLANRLTHQDKKSVECVCLAFSRLVDSFQNDTAKLQEIATPELLTNLQQLLVVQPAVISGPVFMTVLRLLSVLVGACPQLAAQLQQRSLGDTLLCLLCTKHDDQIELIPRSPQELYEITTLVGELFPRLPTDGMFAVDAHLDKPWSATSDAHWQWRDDRGVWRSYSWAESRALEAGAAAGEEEVCLTTLGRSYTVDLTAMQQLNEHTGTARPVQRLQNAHNNAHTPSSSNDPRIALVKSNPALVRSLLSVLHEVYWSAAGPGVKAQALRAVLRGVYYADAALLRQVLKTQLISSHIAAMMASADLRIVVGSLQLGEILMQRLPDEMALQFRREGVLHQVAKLANQHKQSTGSTSSTSPATDTKQRDSEPMSTPTPTSSEGSVVAEAAVASPSTHLLTATSSHRSNSPLQLAEMLKRKRCVKRGSGRHRRRDDHTPELEPATTTTVATGSTSTTNAPSTSRAPLASSGVGAGAGGAASAGSGASSRGASKAASFLSSLQWSRWTRAPHKDSLLPSHQPQQLTQQNKEKVRQWISWRAARLSREWNLRAADGGAVERLRAVGTALAAAADAPRTLRTLRDTLATHDLSPFEVNHSGVLTALLEYLSGVSEAVGTAASSEQEEGTPEQVEEFEQRMRLFLHVFADLPAEIDPQGSLSNLSLVVPLAPESPLGGLVSRVNACVSQLEQFPVRVHELPARPAVSALKFFNTHQLMCDLKRHPTCTNLKQWKGGVVRIDPLALVQAIERYLSARGYATVRARDAAPHSDDDNASDDDNDDSLPTSPHNNANESAEHKLEFLIGDTVLPYNMTVYQAVRQFTEQAADADPDLETAPLANAGIWVATHTIYYRGVSAGEPARADGTSRKGKGQPNKASSRRRHDLLWNEGVVPRGESPLYALVGGGAAWRAAAAGAGGGGADASLGALCVLRALHAAARHWRTLYRADCLPHTHPLLPNTHFLNHKLAAKASRQLQDPLVIMTGNLPPWLKKVGYACPFVFPFEVRHLLFYVVSFDRDRALQRLLEAGGERGGGVGQGIENERVAPRLDRRKRTVQRDNVLRQAEHVMHEYGHSKALLEIQYENEVGTGLGPTLEFYALVSQELQRADLDLWHGSENFKQKPSSFGGDIVKSESGDSSKLGGSVSLEERSPAASELESEPGSPPRAAYVSWPCGLFPQAVGRNVRASHLSRIKAKFRFLGKFMAKAVMDSRLIDIPLSMSMYRWAVGEARWLSLGDARHVAPELWRSLCRLRAVARRAAAIAGDATLTAEQRNDAINGLELDGCPIEELGLDFLLPGEGCELRRGGRDTPVTPHNLTQYIDLVTHWLLYEGVSRQMEAFREGFESVFPLENLRIFYPEELEQVFCGSPSGRESRWEPRMLAECIRPDHGYTAESRAIRMLIDILASYNREDQRLFLQFVTGSPRLPTGGFKALNPPLTVVRKSLEGAADADEYLPSVMTCVNYLKLPDYSSAEVMRAKLRLAAHEGQHSFHLS